MVDGSLFQLERYQRMKARSSNYGTALSRTNLAIQALYRQYGIDVLPASVFDDTATLRAGCTTCVVW